MELLAKIQLQILGRFPKRSWHSFINTENQKFISDEAIDFLGGLLRYNHMERLTAQEAMAHEVSDYQSTGTDIFVNRYPADMSSTLVLPANQRSTGGRSSSTNELRWMWAQGRRIKKPFQHIRLTHTPRT